MLKIYDKNERDKAFDILKNRAGDPPAKVVEAVTQVIEAIKTRGDSALREYSERFDGYCPEKLFMSAEELEARCALVPEELKKTIDRSAANIRDFHMRQKKESWVNFKDGKVVGQRVIPLSRVGVYVPAGSAPLASSVLMCAIPAKVAGVKQVIMATPPKKEGISPALAYAAKAAGVDAILQCGGSQAIAALAYGTESIEKVDKIVGPGNIYVATAKRMVFGAVDIDMIAGPSEVAVIADESADPKYVAADLMSQAEHDPLSAAILITALPRERSLDFAEQVNAELARQCADMPRRDIIERSTSACGMAIIAEDIDEALSISNQIAPEHLELSIADPFSALNKVENAGSVFLGNYSPEPLGDYFAGPNHVLPTNGTARYASALNTDSFIKRSSFIYYNRESLLESADDIISFAEAEQLYAHANSIKVRKERDDSENR